MVGDDLEEAERRFFDGWVDERGAACGCGTPLRPRRSDRRSTASAPASEIVGLFPQPEARP